MSAVPNNVAPLSSAPFLQMRFKGRIEASRLFDGKRYTRFVCPAPDAYSRPQVLEVRSSRAKLGEIGDEFTGTVVVGGFTRKPYRVTDRDTGEQVTLTPVDHVLDLVE